MDGGMVPVDLWNYEDAGTTDQATKELEKILDGKYFDFPKPTELISKMISLMINGETGKDDIIMDFFSGSATTAHSVIQLNSIDDGNRKFIMVQLPELIKGDEGFAFKNICDLAKERIRRIGKKIKEESGKECLDVGFRVFKCDSSNMRDVFYSPDKLNRGFLEAYGDAIKDDRGSEDLLIQVMLELGIELSSSIEKRDMGGHTIFSVDDGYLIACFDYSIDDSTVIEISKEMSGCMYAVFRSGSSMSDEMLANIEQIFKTYSPQTKIRIL